MNQKVIHSTVKEIIVAEGKKLIDNWDKVKIINTKGPEQIDLVTNLDKDVEKSIVNKLRRAFPKTGFQLEEHPELEKDAVYQWVIDPIDGTKYYASHIPFFTISIGLVKNNEPIYGAIYNPVSKQLYTGGINIPAQLNEKPIKISPVTALEKTMLSVDFSKESPEKWPTYKRWVTSKITQLANATYRIRMLGSGTLSLAWVASGSCLNAYVTISSATKFVDVAAGLAICRAAGADIETIVHPIDPNHKLRIVGTRPIVTALKEILTSNI